MPRLSRFAVLGASCVLASCSSVDWWRQCDCSPILDLNDCVVNQDPTGTDPVTTSGDLADTGGGGALASLAGVGAGVPVAWPAREVVLLGAEVCLAPVGDIAIGGVAAAGEKQHLLGISGLNSQTPAAKLRTVGSAAPPVDVAIEPEPVLTSYTEFGWTIVAEAAGSFLVVHGGAPTEGPRGKTNGVKIRISE